MTHSFPSYGVGWKMAWKKTGSPGRRSSTADPGTRSHGRHIAGGDAGRTPREACRISAPPVAIRSAAFRSRNEAKNCFLKIFLKSECSRFGNLREHRIHHRGRGRHCEAAAAKPLQSCPTLCHPIDGSPPGSPVPGILQARTLEWVAISLSNA